MAPSDAPRPEPDAEPARAKRPEPARDRDPGAGAEVFDFVEAHAADRAAGRARTLAEYLARWPHCQEAIAREWLALEREARGEDVHAVTAVEVENGLRVGAWRLLREIGRGGQGQVWLAQDTRIERHAALKLLPESVSLVPDERRRRLRREAQVLARLDHPSLCPILEADLDGARPFLAMRLIEGRSLAECLADGEEHGNGLTLPPRERAHWDVLLELFEAAARALHVAHEAGVVHRDVKPSNVMLTQDGRPVLVDFGQARDELSSLDVLTLSGEVFGTPAYMSPEQVRGARNLDRRTDVWSLGVALFECATGERPFRGATVSELLVAIAQRPAPRLTELRRDVPRDLERELTVVLETALEKDLARRYAHAAALADDLKRVRLREPVSARAPGHALRAWRWSRAHPAVAAALSSVILALSVGLAWTVHLLAREARALDWALGSHLAKRTLALIDEDPAAALALGIEAVEKAPNYETREALHGALDACHLRSELAGAPARRIQDLDVDPRGELVAAALDDGAVRVFSLSDGRILIDARAPLDAGRPLRAVRFVDGGRALVAGGERGALCTLELPAHPLELRGTRDVRAWTRERPGPGGPVVALATSPDGTRWAALDDRGGLLVQDAHGQDARCELAGGPFQALRFAPDGASLLVSSRAFHGEGTRLAGAALWVDADTACTRRELSVAPSTLTWADFDAAGGRVVLAALDGSVRVVDLAQGQTVAGPYAFAGPVWCAALAPDGRQLAVACEEGLPTRTWSVDLKNGARRPLLGNEQARATHVSYSPDGARIASACFDTTVRLFDSASGRALEVFRGFNQPLSSRWSQDGKSLVTLGNGNTAPVWIARGRDDTFTLPGSGAPIVAAAFSRDGACALTAARDGSVRLWSARSRVGQAPTGECVAQWNCERALAGAAFTPDGAWALAWGAGGHLCVHDARNGSELPFPIGAKSDIVEVACAPLAAQAARATGLAVRTADGLVYAVDLAAGVWTLVARDASTARFSRDGGSLAVGRRGGVELFDSGTLRSQWSAEGIVEAAGGDAGRLVDVAFDPDGSEIAAIGSDRRITFLDRTGRRTRDPLVAITPIRIDWSRDGSRLLVVGSEGRGALRLQDLEQGVQVRNQIFHAGNLTCGSFSEDGALVLTGSLDGTVFVRDARDGTPVAHLVGHSGAVLAAAFGPGPAGLRVITASADGSARVWPVDPLPAARARKPRELRDWERAREARLALPLSYR